ncbi:LuxR C-terminal-related transcriptional regulator [Leucobacter sp. USCH14]|uniref:helix-turn-helix transcriptional regulator n=1 Tax=Leucobacter sp. USCH14 TaxID=3024838 RepID=UPI0030A5D6BF
MSYLRKLGDDVQRLEQDHVQRILSDAVVAFARETRFDIAFGGLECSGNAVLTAVTGAEHGAIEGLLVRADRGLGGRAMRECRPRIAANYVTSRQITHEYDSYIARERIVGLLAFPVLVDGSARAVLYGGSRGPAMPEGAFVRAAAGVARDLSRELRIEDEVSRRFEARRRDAGADPSAQPASLSPRAVELLRNVHAELRGALAEAPSSRLRERLRSIEHRLTDLTTATRASRPRAPASSAVRLSPRELDALAHVALGSTNAEIGQSLGLAENTVKSYLNTAMTKLDATTRHAAVSRARALGLLV